MLESYHRALLSLGFAQHPPSDLSASFAPYRAMIRGRLVSMARVAYRNSFALLGEDLCCATFMRYLADCPPSSPFIREVIGGFAEFAASSRELALRAPFASDLLHFEAEKWRIADVWSAEPDTSVRELDFEGVPVVNPTLSLLALRHSVDAQNAVPEPCAPFTLFMYRRADDDAVRWYRAMPLLAALLSRAQAGACSFAAALPAAFVACELVPDENLLHDLASALTLAVERGVLYGVRAE